MQCLLACLTMIIGGLIAGLVDRHRMRKRGSV